ncbi:hypothetical protein [Tardiphaga sp. 709]|uniref:hypothetical protein n=1 Tax=Tardiphaga sp. 709 TaxID=3076039 RepID=UPI0028E1DC5D|nr:hypothetical protein [Tardiphaga sp. 709]WNV10000.1 hypothetical protein RSO67_02025 [Tardiphaga sp. 709]
MSTDLVERLREADIGWSGDAACVSAEVAEEAAAEITKLRAERDAARNALKPFATAAADVHEKAFDADNLWESPAAMNLTAGHLRAASALFATTCATPSEGQS